MLNNDQTQIVIVTALLMKMIIVLVTTIPGKKTATQIKEGSYVTTVHIVLMQIKKQLEMIVIIARTITIRINKTSFHHKVTV